MPSWVSREFREALERLIRLKPLLRIPGPAQRFDSAKAMLGKSASVGEVAKTVGLTRRPSTGSRTTPQRLKRMVETEVAYQFVGALAHTEYFRTARALPVPRSSPHSSCRDERPCKPDRSRTAFEVQPPRSSPIHERLRHYYGLLRPCAPLRYSRPRGWSRLWLIPWHRRTGSHVPYESLVELRAAYMPDATQAVSGHPPS